MAWRMWLSVSGSGREKSGSAYVVFGKVDGKRVDLAALGTRGFRIDGRKPKAAPAIAGAGDVNGDGMADVLVGASGADHNGRKASGSAYVVFGAAGPDRVDLLSSAPAASASTAQPRRITPAGRSRVRAT